MDTNKPGFKNAPYITEFKVGMDFGYDGCPLRVMWISNGFMHCMSHRGSYHCHVRPSYISDCTLDLDSIWVGREYLGHDSVTRIILMVDNDLVAYKTTSGWFVTGRDDFMDDNEAVHVKSPEPTCVRLTGKDVARHFNAGDYVEITSPEDNFLVIGTVDCVNQKDLVLKEYINRYPFSEYTFTKLVPEKP